MALIGSSFSKKSGNEIIFTKNKNKAENYLMCCRFVIHQIKRRYFMIQNNKEKNMLLSNVNGVKRNGNGFTLNNETLTS